MNLYAPPSATLARQVCLDVLVVAWCVGWWFVGRAADSAIRGLAAVPRSAEQSARDLQERLNEAAEAAGRVPLAGESLRAPLDGIAQSVNGLIAGQYLNRGQRVIQVSQCNPDDFLRVQMIAATFATV